MTGTNQEPVHSRGWKRRLIILACWFLLWAAVPALFVWGMNPYVRGPTLPLDGKSHVQLEAELNHRYAIDYLISGAVFGLVGGFIAVRLQHVWQVLLLSVTCGMGLVATFNLRNLPAYIGVWTLAGDGMVGGGIFGIVLGIGLGVVHRLSHVAHKAA